MISDEKIELMKLRMIKCYFIIVFFEAFWRYLFGIVGISEAIYIKDVLIVFIFILSLKTIKINKKNSIIILTTLIALIVSRIYVDNIKQIIFALVKVILIFYVGLFNYKLILYDFNKNKKFYLCCLFLLITGVVLNNFTRFPWEGSSYTIDGVTIEVSRYWETNGVRRLAGFSRTSFNGAVYIAILAIIYYVNKEKYSKLDIGTLILIAGVIYMTTCKGVLVALLAIILYKFLNNNYLFAKVCCLIAIFVMVFLPLFSLISEPIFEELKDTMEQEDYVRYVASFEDRCLNVWPNVFDFITTEGDPIFGRGIGGIGSAQGYYGSESYPPDNLFLYLYGTFGIMCIVYIILPYKNVFIKEEKSNMLLVAFALFIFTYSCVNNTFEEPIICILLGMLTGYNVKKDV